MILDRLLIALRLKKKPPEPKPSFSAALMPKRYAGHVPPRAFSPPAPPPRRTYEHQVVPSQAPAPDTSSDLMNAVLLNSLLHSNAPAQDCRREAEPEPFRSGLGGDFAGAGAGGGWEPSPAPSYEPPAPSPGYDYSSSSNSDYSSSSDSGSSSSCSSD